MKIKIKIKLLDGSVREHIAENILNSNKTLRIIPVSGDEGIIYNWDDIKSYESTKLNNNLESING